MKPGKATGQSSSISHPNWVHVIPEDVAGRESSQKPLTLALSGPAAVHDSVAAAHAFADAAGFAHATRSRLAIVVEELVTNLYDHGELAPDEAFELDSSATAGVMRLR